MGDLTEIQAAMATKIVGSDALGGETTPVKTSPNQDLAVSDILNIASASGVLTLLPGTVYELRVSASALANRKYVIMQALDPDVKWGLGAASQPFYAYQSQIIMMPVGDATIVYFRTEPGGYESQYIGFSAVPTAGTWLIKIDGYTTGYLAYNATAATVQSALITAGVSVTVTGNYSLGFTVVFSGVMRNAPQLTVKTTGLVAGAVPVTTTILTIVEGAAACAVPRRIAIGELS